MLIVPRRDINYLDEVLLDRETKRLKILPASEYDNIDRQDLILWCYQNGRYGLPTQETIDYLKEQIGGRTALELGAGQGDLGHALGIRMTDSCIQRMPELVFHYRTIGHMPTDPPSDVLKYEALEAVKLFKPQVAIASWLTQKFEQGDTEKRIGSSIYGVDEIALIQNVETYIHIGALGPHKDKRALRMPHEAHPFTFLKSRATDPKSNLIYKWGK